MAEERRELQEAGYATLGQAVVGHVMISVVIAPLVVGVLWLLGLIMQPGTGVGAIVVLGLVTTVASEVLMALGERPAVVRARHSTPGGWAYAVWIFFFPPIVGTGIGGWQAPELALPSGLAALVVFWASACAVKPWRRALRKADYQATWEATRKWLQEAEENS